MTAQSLWLHFRAGSEIPGIQVQKQSMINGIAVIVGKGEACQPLDGESFSAGVKSKGNISEVLHRPY